jgi:predicted adenylyl cyclase CyaB
MVEEGDRRANVELKARYEDHERAVEACVRLGARLETVELQRDTYFSTGAYRMKLRESSLGNHWLIWYSRPDDKSSRKSDYRLLPVPDPAEKRRILEQAMSVKAEVVKERTLYLLGPVRIHLDVVEGLGECIEFEYVLEEGEDEARAHEKIAVLRDEFGIREEDLIAGSYSDLVGARAPSRA